MLTFIRISSFTSPSPVIMTLVALLCLISCLSMIFGQVYRLSMIFGEQHCLSTMLEECYNLFTKFQGYSYLLMMSGKCRYLSIMPEGCY